MVPLRELADIAAAARGEKARLVMRLLRRMMVTVKNNLRLEASLQELEGDAREEGSSGEPPTPQPETEAPAREKPALSPVVTPAPLAQQIDFEAPTVVDVKKSVPPRMSPPKSPKGNSPKDTVAESISRLLHRSRPADPAARPILPEPFEVAISDEPLLHGILLAAQHKQLKTREDVLGVLDSFTIVPWGACAECTRGACAECKDGGIRAKMAFDTVCQKPFAATAWKGQIAALLGCSVPLLVQAWVERPEEVTARLSEYLGRPFHVSGVTKEWQGEISYSLIGLTCLHWGAVATFLNHRVGEIPASAAGDVGGENS